MSNESAEIIRMFNSAFDGIGAAAGDYYPQDLRAEIDALNDRIYPNLNNGVYCCVTPILSGNRKAPNEAH